MRPAAGTGARTALLLAGRGGRPLRFAGSELARGTSLGWHGLRQARRSAALAPAAAVRHRLYRQFWSEAAAHEGATVTDLGDGLLRLERDGAVTTVWDNLVPLDDPVSTGLAGSRARSHALLQAAGVTVPRHVLADVADSRSWTQLLREGRTCVVKPAAGTGAGAGITCGVSGAAELRAAVGYAARWASSVVVEELVQGVEHRVLVLDGEVVGTVLRLPPVVVGDGRSTVGQLVVAENALRLRAGGGRGLFPLTLDLDAVGTLRRAGRTLRTVPAAGEQVQLKTAVNEGGPAQTLGTAAAPPAVADTAVRAARAVGLRLAAVEIVHGPTNATPVVLEVNSTPGLHYHYVVAESSERTAVCRPLLRTLLGRGEPR